MVPNTDHRFESVSMQNVDDLKSVSFMEIIRDKFTGVHYFVIVTSGGMSTTVLLNKDGKPVVT